MTATFDSVSEFDFSDVPKVFSWTADAHRWAAGIAVLIGVRLWSRKRNAKSGWNDATVAIPESHRTWVGGSFGGKQEIASVGRRHLSRRAVVIL